MKVYLLLVVIFIIPISLKSQRVIYSNTVYVEIPSSDIKKDSYNIELEEKLQPKHIDLKIEKEDIFFDDEDVSLSSNVKVDTVFENNRNFQEIRVSFEPQFFGKKRISDFPSGGYLLKTSKISNQLSVFVKKTLEHKIIPFLDSSSIVIIRIKGTADATAIKGIKYEGEFGKLIKEQYKFEKQNIDFSVKINSYISKNDELAFLRTFGIRKYLESNIHDVSNLQFEHVVEVHRKSGEQFRTVTLEVLIKKEIPEL